MIIVWRDLNLFSCKNNSLSEQPQFWFMGVYSISIPCSYIQKHNLTLPPLASKEKSSENEMQYLLMDFVGCQGVRFVTLTYI